MSTTGLQYKQRSADRCSSDDSNEDEMGKQIPWHPVAGMRERVATGVREGRAPPRDRGGTRHALDERRHREVYGGRMSDGSICCSSGLHLRGAREYGRLKTGLLRTMALLVLMGYTRGKMRCTGLAQMLGGPECARCVGKKRTSLNGISNG